MMDRARPPLYVIVASLAAGLLLAGCGDDGSDESSDPTTAATATTTSVSPATTAAEGASSQAACDAFVAIDQAFTIEEDVEAGISAIEAFVAAAPADVGAKVQPILPLLREDPEAVLEGESEELAVAEAAADAYAFDSCSGTKVDIDAVNFAFVGVPAEIDAGRVVFRLTNNSQTGELHEALLLRKMDGSTESARDILAGGLGEENTVEATMAALEQFDFIGVGFVEPDPDGRQQDVFAVDLEPGQYVLACLLPVNSPELIEAYFSGEPVDAPHHFDEGMFAEFTVG